MKPIKKNKYGIKEKMVSFINVNILLLLIFSLKFSSSVEVTNKIQSKLLVDLLKASLYKQKPILEANLPTVTTSKQDKNLIENTRNNNLELNKLVIKEKDTLFQCWVKYFHYTSIQDKPNSFFINNKFDKQVASQKNYFEQKDEFGTLNIPDNTSFFAVMQQDKVNILEKRINSSINYIDVLNIELVGRIPDDDPLEGSIKNFGLFEEGFCFRVVSYVPNKYYTMTLTNPDPKGNDSATEFWVFCVNDKEKKEKLMLWIIKSKLHMQSKIGYHEFAKSNEKVDGRWEILKNWGECSMAGGGGLQYQQLICILPRNGGKPCEGKNIKSRP